MVNALSVWALPDDLIEFILKTFFSQTRQDGTALVHGRLVTGQTYAWLYCTDHYYPISLDAHETFRLAACSREGFYSLEICDFAIEKTFDNGDIQINFWRRIGDESGEGGRVILSHKQNTWVVRKRLTGWRDTPDYI